MVGFELFVGLELSMFVEHVDVLSGGCGRREEEGGGALPPSLSRGTIGTGHYTTGMTRDPCRYDERTNNDTPPKCPNVGNELVK